jgi:hypothetical protein
MAYVRVHVIPGLPQEEDFVQSIMHFTVFKTTVISTAVLQTSKKNVLPD